MGKVYGTYVGKKSAYNVMQGKLEGKRPLGRQRHRWEDNSDWGFYTLRFFTLTEVFLNLTEAFLTLTEVFPCFFLSFKANARVKLAKTGHGPHSSTLVVICVVRLLFVLFYVLFVCKCVLPPADNPVSVNKYIISYRSKKNTEMHLEETGWEEVDWIDLAEDRDMEGAHKDKVMNLSTKWGEFHD